jgi:SAM-dependent methyltransferase
MTSEPKITDAVQRLYDTYPFPPDPLTDAPPPGYNWRWHWQAAYSFCTGRKPSQQAIQILDAGCGTGVGTEYLCHLNPEAEVTAIDLSPGALAVAQERCQRTAANNVQFHNLSLYDVDQLEGEFDLINCVGVLHHLPDPIRGIQALSRKLAIGGLLHIFVYGELGRWEISLMQEAIAIIQQDQLGDYQDGVAVGRQIFAALPEKNRLRQREQQRWSFENHWDASFADMYVHPQEVDYNIESLFELIEASGLEFVGFSNPKTWQLERVLGEAPELIARAESLSDRQKYRLIEVLDPEAIAHYEFFLTRPPLVKADWSKDAPLLAAIPELNPCIDGWPSNCLFNYNYEIVRLTDPEFAFLQACDGSRSVGEVLAAALFDLAGVRSLLSQQLILLTPA